MSTGFQRTLVVALDPAQYQLDVNAMAAAPAGSAAAQDLYASFNYVMRRSAKENNFKAVLESIRDIMNENVIIPDWLQNIFLGYGDPAAAHYTNMTEGLLNTVDFRVGSMCVW